MHRSLLVTPVVAIALVAAAASVALAQHQHGESNAPAARFEIPRSLNIEHQALHTDLTAAIKLSGKTGAAAQKVADVLHAHFVSEEEFALPPLGLLAALSRGETTPEMHEVVALTDRLRKEMPRMLDEHRAIVAALEEMRRAAESEGHAEAVRFTEELTLHARNEEEVLYPSAILVGEIVKLKTH